MYEKERKRCPETERQKRNVSVEYLSHGSCVYSTLLTVNNNSLSVRFGLQWNESIWHYLCVRVLCRVCKHAKLILFISLALALSHAMHLSLVVGLKIVFMTFKVKRIVTQSNAICLNGYSKMLYCLFLFLSLCKHTCLGATNE